MNPEIQQQPTGSSASAASPVQPSTTYTTPIQIAPMTAKKSHLGLIIGSVIAAILLLFILGGAIVGYMKVPNSASERAAQLQTTSRSPAISSNADNKTSSLACLTQEDYKWMNYDKQPSSVNFDPTYDPASYTVNKTENMFFKADSTDEDSLLSVYDDWADFAKHAPDKQWKFRLEGSINGKNADSEGLANKRAERVKQQLISRGVPADRIIIDPPVIQSDASYDSIFRRVQVVVDPTCITAPSSGTGR